MAFTNIISSEEELRALMGEPVSPLVVDKTLSTLDRHCDAFISRSPFVMVATTDADGRMDISPKGDAPGFVRLLDANTLAIPDRPGNQRFDSFRNLLQSPRIGLIFLIPGKRETLRISGSAQIVADPALCESMAVNGKVPTLAIVVAVEEAFFHCAKSMVRSQLWKPEQWPTLDGLPSLAETMRDATGFDVPLEFIDERVQKDEKERLY